jgi:autotransporter-associated beta strand protein
LLATSSVVALAAGGPSAWAACATITGNSAGFTNPSGTTIDCIHIVNGTVTGNVVNAGTLSPGGPFGISVDQTSTVSGAIVNTGVISAARGLQDVGRMTGGFNNSGTITGGEAVFIDGQTALAPTFLGGITNTGTMTASGTNGIFLSPTIFSGGISNGGTISGGTNGIAFIFTTLASPATTPNTFTGGVANTGTITAAGGDAIHLTGGRLSGAPVTAEGTFSGGIVNSGVLSGSANGVYVASFREFGGGIANNLGGSITASGGDGILVDLVTTGGIQAAITNFAGGVTNAGRITASANGIRLLGISSFSGSVSNSGTITANGGDGFRVDHASYAGTISNSGTITASVNGIFVSNTVENAVANSGTIHAGSGAGISVQGNTLIGGVTNSGTITSSTGAAGIFISPSVAFSGGFTNTGSVTATGAGSAGLNITTTPTFVGGITNSGTLTGANVGISIGIVSPVVAFSGGITNSGTISGQIGIEVRMSNTFSGGITNTGNITGTVGAAIDLSLSPNAVTVSQQAGTVTGAIVLSNFGDTVNITGGTVAGNITGGGGLGTVNFAPVSGSFTYSNTISNLAAVNVNSGTLFLQGTLSPTAVTIANGATLNVGAGGNITPDITDNGTFAVQRATAFSYGGVISGTGVVQQLGPGTTTLTGTNTYLGGTQINGGTLAINNDGNLGNVAGGLSFNGGTLRFLGGTTINRAITLNAGGGTFDTNGFNEVLGGPITGVGGLTKVGVGTLQVGGPGTYSGATNVSAGTLQAGNANVFSTTSAYTVASGAVLDLNNFSQTIGSLAGAGNVGLGSAVLTTGSDNTSTTYSGIIAGTGGVTKTGTGTLTLSNTSGYTGPTVVNGGTLSVNGSIATSNGLDVNNGGTVGGTGFLPTTRINAGGTLSPGNSIGTITVASLMLSTAATYLVQVSGTTADRTNVTGAAALAGTLQVAYLTAPVFGQNYIILHAGTRSGTFGTVTTNNSGITTTVTYTPTDVILSTSSSLATGGGGLGGGGGGGGGQTLNQNQRNVATTLDTAFNAGQNPGAFAALFTLAPGGLPFALSQLTGEIGTAAPTASFQDMAQFLELMLDPFLENRGAGAGFGAPALSFAPEEGAGPSNPASAFARMPTKALPMAPALFDARWTAWGAGYGASGTFNGNAVIGSQNLTARSGGVAAGLDYRVSPDTVIGFAAAGSALSYGLDNSLGTGRGDSFKVGVYGSTRRDNAYLSASAAYGYYDLSTDRTVMLPGVLDQLKGKFTANSFGGRIEAGYRVPVTASAGITPYAALQAQVFQQPNYVETDLTGLAAFALRYASRSFDEERSELGARFDTRVPTSDNSVLLLRGRLAWAHEFSGNPAVTAGFVTLPGTSFVVTGAGLPRDALLVSLGPELRMLNGWTLRAKFDGAFARQSQSYAGTGTVRYSW